MKKIILIMALVVGLTGAAHATGDYRTDCSTWHTGCSAVDGVDGVDGQDGIDGINGQDGQDGADGQDGKDGAAGADGQDGVDGATGSTGASGADGVDGADGSDGVKGDKGDTGTTGSTGSDGIDGNDGAAGQTGTDGLDGQDGSNGTNGTNGEDGKDGEVLNFEEYKAELSHYQEGLDNLIDYSVTAAAGAIATSSIDFGTVAKGQTEVGLGFGVSGGDFYGSTETGYAGAAGLKYGLTDEDAVITKAWAGKNSAYGIGVGVTHRF